MARSALLVFTVSFSASILCTLLVADRPRKTIPHHPCFWHPRLDRREHLRERNLVFITYGVGMLVGAQISGWVFNAIVPDPSILEAWKTFWWIPAAFAGAVMAFFAATFRDQPSKR